MRWIRYTFIGLASLLIAAVAMLVTLVLLLDQNQLRDGLVFVVNRSTDHQLQINGPLQLDLSRSPAVRVSDIHFKTADDDFELSAAEIHLRVDVASLWSNYLIVPEFLVRESTVNVRQLPNETGEAHESFQPVEARIPVFGEIRVENLVINYSQPGDTEPLQINVQSLEKADQPDKAFITLTGAGSIDGTAFRFAGESGSATSLLTTDEPYPFNYRFEVLQAVIQAEGRIVNPLDAAELDSTLKIKASDVHDILKLLHMNAPDMGSLEATARLSGTVEAPRLDDIDLKISKEAVAVRLSGTVGNLFAAEDLQLDVSSVITDAELLAWLLPEQSPRFNSIRTSGRLSGSAVAPSLSHYTLEATDASGYKLELAGSARIIDAPQPLRDLTTTLSLAAPDTALARQVSESIPLLGPLAGTARLSMVSDVLHIDEIRLTAGEMQTLQIDASGNIKLGVTADKLSLAGLALDIGLQAPSTTSLTTITGTDVPALGRIKATAHVSDSAGSTTITDLDVKIDKGKDLQLAVKGSLADLEKQDGLDMTIELSASNLNAIGQLFDQPLPREGQVKFSGHATGSLGQTRITGRADLGNTTSTTDLTAALTGKRPRLEGSISIPDLDVHDIGLHPERRAAAAAAATPGRKEFAEAASEQAAMAEALFSREPFDFSGLHAIDLDLEITIDKLSSTPKSIADIYSHVLLENGTLQIKPLKYSVDNDVINNDIMIDSATQPPAVSLLVSGDDIDLGLLLARANGEASPVRGIMTARADLKGRGRSPAELAASLDGKIDVVAENARIAQSALKLITVDVIGWAISNIFSPNKDVNIDCAIFIMHFDKGVGTTDLHIIDTPETLIKIDAKLDLANETMDIAIVPEHKIRLFKTKKDPIEIWGPIANPQYKLVSVKDLAQETGRAALLAPLTVSVGLLGSIADLIVEPDEPTGSCDKFVK